MQWSRCTYTFLVLFVLSSTNHYYTVLKPNHLFKNPTLSFILSRYCDFYDGTAFTLYEMMCDKMHFDGVQPYNVRSLTRTHARTAMFENKQTPQKDRGKKVLQLLVY